MISLAFKLDFYCGGGGGGGEVLDFKQGKIQKEFNLALLPAQVKS